MWRCLRYDTAQGVWRDVPGTDALARALIDAGASVDGSPGDRETPLITAATYGDAAVALEWCIHARDRFLDGSSHDRVEAILRPLTMTD